MTCFESQFIITIMQITH